MIPSNYRANRTLQFLARKTLYDCWHSQPKSRRNSAGAAGAAAAAFAPCLVCDSDCLGGSPARGNHRVRRPVQPEGQYAGAAREMVEAHQWLLPTNDGTPRLQKPPLLYWLIIISYKLFGIN